MRQQPGCGAAKLARRLCPPAPQQRPSSSALYPLPQLQALGAAQRSGIRDARLGGHALPARAGRALHRPRARPTDLGLAAVGRQQLGCGARLAPGRRRRDELAQLGARMLQLAQLHLYPHRHPLEAPEGLRAGAAASHAAAAASRQHAVRAAACAAPVRVRQRPLSA